MQFSINVLKEGLPEFQKRWESKTTVRYQQNESSCLCALTASFFKFFGNTEPYIVTNNTDTLQKIHDSFMFIIAECDHSTDATSEDIEFLGKKMEILLRMAEEVLYTTNLALTDEFSSPMRCVVLSPFTLPLHVCQLHTAGRGAAG